VLRTVVLRASRAEDGVEVWHLLQYIARNGELVRGNESVLGVNVAMTVGEIFAHRVVCHDSVVVLGTEVIFVAWDAMRVRHCDEVVRVVSLSEERA